MFNLDMIIHIVLGLVVLTMIATPFLPKLLTK